MKSYLLAALPACMLAATLTSCTNAGAGGVALLASPSHSAATHLHSWMTPGAASGDLLYISDAGYDGLYPYPLGGAPIRMQPFSAPVAVVVSRAPH